MTNTVSRNEDEDYHSGRVAKPVPFLATGCICLLGAAALILALMIIPRRSSTVIEEWKTGVGEFTLRVTAFGEEGMFGVPGAYYRFECQTTGDSGWKEIVTIRHDDPIAIPRDQIRRVNDKVAYSFMCWIYAVTTDAGKSWSIWHGDREPAAKGRCGYDLIHNVAMDDQGMGVMYLNLIDTPRPKELRLFTRDFGRSWVISGPGNGHE